MRVLHISTNDDGGAGIAALRLHKVMLEFGIDSSFLCLNKTTDVNNVFVHPKFYPRFYHRILSKIGIRLTQLEKQFSFQKKAKKYFNAEIFSLPGSDYKLHKTDLVKRSDVIILHWVSGFLNYSTFFKKIDKHKRILWYSHDFNPVLGGFHTLFDVERNKESAYYYIETKLKKIKTKYLSKNYINFIANSNFSFENLLRQGILANFITTIPLGIPKSELERRDKTICKKALGINEECFTLILVSTSWRSARKGFDRLEIILRLLSEEKVRCNLIMLGNDKSLINIEGINYICLGNVWSTILKSVAFSAADVVLSTSYEETFGQTIVEGYACGTPAISFDNAAVPEIIRNGHTGFIVKSTDEFVEKLKFFDANRSLVTIMGDKAFGLFEEKYTTELHLQKLMEILEVNSLEYST